MICTTYFLTFFSELIPPTGYIKVSCRENGVEIYNRNYYVKGRKNQLFELNIPKDYRYSSGQQVKPQVK